MASTVIHPWWPDLHSTIIKAFKRNDIQAFPPTWTRLNPDLVLGASGLAKELEPSGSLVVLFDDGIPVACSGVLPSRGENWINETSDAHHNGRRNVRDETATASPTFPAKLSPESTIITDWEIWCFCVDPRYRKLGLSRVLLTASRQVLEPLGAERLVANYSIEETVISGLVWGSRKRLGRGVCLGRALPIHLGWKA
ncbi:hypothetical protein D0866_11432 [Hortaea werneckii]|uniref:Uncharacterized protein n=1 Tax=Hortaea werneckii TaxID=91943 RepID=A0A3M7AA75_HORWE|nr:hypothetical protein D0866_11432 [Hortaea werneckii]